MKPAKKKQTLPKPSPSSSAKASGYHHGNLREKVLEHSKKVLETTGVSSLSLRDIANDLGVSHTAPYRHFPKKWISSRHLSRKVFGN